MGVKAKRKSVKSGGEGLSLEKEVEASGEPPSKKPKVLTADDFIKSLRGPTASEAVKEWLLLISNKKEKSLINEDRSSFEAKSKTNPSNSVNIEVEKSTGGEETTLTLENEVEEEEDFDKDHASTDAEESESVKHIDAFLNAGGSPADLVYTLPAPDGAQISNLRHVFRALSKIILRIAAEHHDKINEAVEVCRDLVNTYSKHINDMLKIQRSPQERKLNLELLTAMVSLDPKFAKEVLNSISLEADNIDHLTSGRVSHYTRIAYLKFLIALLIGADNSLVMVVVNKPWLLISIMDGLQYDPSDLIVLLLTTIKKAILENRSVPKSAKLIIFNADAIISLLHLYKWKGPQNRPKSLTFWAMKKMAEKPKLMAEVDSTEADLVASSVQELLLVLLTDHRFGVIFRDTGIAHQSDRHNKMVSRVLLRIGHPWENPKVAELVSKVLAACPDSLHSTLVSIEPFLEPRSSPKWFLCAKFIKQVLQDQSPEEVLHRQISWLTMMQLSAAAIEMCAPKSVLCALSSNNAAALHMDDIAVVKCTLDVLVSMLRKMNNFVKVVRRWASESTLTYAQATSFRRHVTDVLLKHIPKLEVIQKSWLLWSEKYLEGSQAVSSDETVEKPIDILSLLMELLEMYQQLCPAALDPLHSAQSDLKSSMTTTVLKATDAEDAAQLRNRLYKFLLAINDSSFCVENTSMEKPMRLTFYDVIRPCPTVRSLAFSVLQTLISNAGCLEGGPQEAIVWLSVFQETFDKKEDLSDAVVNMLVESMTRTCTSCPKYLDIIACAEEGAVEMLNLVGTSVSSTFDGAVLQELFDEAMESHDTPQPSSYLAQVYAATLSPWVTAFLEVLREHSKEKKIKRRHRQVCEEFTCKLILRILYRLPHPSSFLYLLLHTYSDVVPSSLQNYVQSWLPSGSPEPIGPGLLDADALEVKLSLFYFENDAVSLPNSSQKLFVNLALPKVDDYIQDFSDVECLETMAQMIKISYFISFHLSQLAQLGKLTKQHTEKSQEILLLLSDTALHFDRFRTKGKDRGFFFECFKVILSHPILFQQFNPLLRHNSESSKLLTNLISVVAKKASCCNALQGYLVPYKDKLLVSLMTAIKTVQRKKKSTRGNVVFFVDAFPLQFQEISDLLVSLSNLPSTSMVVDDASEMSQWCLLTTNLLSCATDLRTKGNLKESDIMSLPSAVISQVCKWLLEILPSSSCDLSPLVDALVQYIRSCPQQTCHIPHELLACLLNAKQISLANGRLAEWLAHCIPASDILSTLKSSISAKSDAHERLPVILPVIQEVLRKKEMEGSKKSILMRTYELMKEEVQLSVISLTNHPHWLAPNIDVVLALMKRFMKSDVKESLCKALEKKAPALNQEKLYYLKLVMEVVQNNPPQLLLLLVAWLGVSVKKYGNSPDHSCLVGVLCQAIIDFLGKDNCNNLASVRNSKAWQETLRLSLKFGLVAGREEEGGTRNSEIEIPCLLLKTLSILIKRMYPVNEDHEDVQMVHSMITQHSEFINIMMGSSPSKFELVQLLYVALIQSPKIMDNSHVPILLAAYNASLSKTDRAILRILMLYEQSGVDLSHFRPYFWGRQGANHYSVWSTGSKPIQTLWQQPRPDQVLGLLDDSMIRETVGKFPIHSTLSVKEGENDFIDGIYDPSFFLPLFMYLLSPESPVLTHMFVKSGALALTLSSLSSFDVAIRAAAYTTLSRFISHLQMARGRNKDLLLQFMSAVQKGISAYGNDNPRLPSIVSVFLARSVIEIANPSSTLYKPLINFILAKPAMNLRTVPEFLPLLHSDHVEHLSHQHWICDVIKEGLRSPVDVVLCMEVAAFKLLQSFYTSCLSAFKSKVKILCCLTSAARVQYGACYLMRDYCLASWLHQSIVDFGSEDATLIIEMVRLLSALWESLSSPSERKKDAETARSSPIVENPARKLLSLLLPLHLKLSAPVGLDCLNQYLYVLHNVTANLTVDDSFVFPKETLLSIIDVMSPHCFNKRQFLDLLDLGCQFIDLPTIVNPKGNATEEDIRLLLQVLTIQWMRCQNPKS